MNRSPHLLPLGQIGHLRGEGMYYQLLTASDELGTNAMLLASPASRLPEPYRVSPV